MKASSMAASTAAALSLLHFRNPADFEKLLQHLTPSSLTTIEARLNKELESSSITEHLPPSTKPNKESLDEAIAEAVLRRLVYKCLQKHSEVSSHQRMERALKYHVLPKSLKKELAERYGGAPPQTWYDSLQQLTINAGSNSTDGRNATFLWEMILNHPMTAYVPVQCQCCGHVIPDDLNSSLTDEQVGLVEVEPTLEESAFVRPGWFRGPRPNAMVFELTCPKCSSLSRWFRSRDPQIILNPNKWGRLCGEQEDLRLDLANYLGIPIRTCLPLDWDHVWSEYSVGTTVDTSTSTQHQWELQDDNARNFAVRLDEGSSSWTGVLAIHPDPNLCEDVTDQYLSCTNMGGRADDKFESELHRYREIVVNAKKDASGTTTQAGTVVGYVLQRAGFDADRITTTMVKAAKDYGSLPWYELPLENEV